MLTLIAATPPADRSLSAIRGYRGWRNYQALDAVAGFDLQGALRVRRFFGSARAYKARMLVWVRYKHLDQLCLTRTAFRVHQLRNVRRHSCPRPHRELFRRHPHRYLLTVACRLAQDQRVLPSPLPFSRMGSLCVLSTKLPGTTRSSAVRSCRYAATVPHTIAQCIDMRCSRAQRRSSTSWASSRRYRA